MKNIKIITLLLVCIILLSSTACSSIMMGNVPVEDKKEVSNRIELAFNWLSQKSLVSDGKSTVSILKKDGMGKQKVSSPPKGSVFLFYQDIATKSRDGFLPFVSTESETQYIRTICDIYEKTNDKKLISNAIDVAQRLVNKIFYAPINNEQNNTNTALIYRATKYDYATNRWIDLKDEAYTEDILNTITALIRLSEVTKSNSYDTYIKDLLKTIEIYQNQIKNEQKSCLNGSLYYMAFNYNHTNKYSPSYYIYPLYFTLDMYDSLTLAYNYLNDEKYKNILDDYMNWVEKTTNIKSFWNENNICYTGIDGLGYFINKDDKGWNINNDITSEEVIKMIYGLSLWKPEIAKNFTKIFDTVLATKVFSRWDISEYISQSGIPSFKGDYVETTKDYLAMYMNLLNKAEKDEILLDTIRNQRTKGDNISKGAWVKGVYTDIRSSLISIRILYHSFY